MTTSEWIRRAPWVLILCVLALMLIGIGGIIRGDELQVSPRGHVKAIRYVESGTNQPSEGTPLAAENLEIVVFGCQG